MFLFSFLKEYKRQKRLLADISCQLETQSFRLALLVEIIRSVNSADTKEDVLHQVIQASQAVCQAKGAAIAIFNKDSTRLSLAACRGFDVFSNEKAVFDKDFQGTLAWQAAISGESVVDERTDPMSILQMQCAVPLSNHQHVLGVLMMYNMNDFDEDKLDFISILASQATTAFVNVVNYHRVKERARDLDAKAHTDSLTSLYNRFYMQERCPEEMSHCKRTSHPLSLLMFDVDHFKSFNDRYGHPFGDIVLRDIAMLAKQCIRQHDIPIRYGGEEFIILLPDSSADMATVAAERLRKAVETHEFYDPEKKIKANVTISIGAAEWDRKGDLKVLIDQADKALYAAKEGGRNRVVRHTGASASS
jgi:diguanylate cyclase (GGDEF)-like protein